MLTIFRLETEIFRPENPEIKLKTNFELKKPKFGQIWTEKIKIQTDFD